MRFKDRWKPETTIHLGDFMDTAGWRAGARNSNDDPDHGSNFQDDYQRGMATLTELRPQVVLWGNHEARLTGLVKSSSAVVAYAAEEGVKAIEAGIKKLRAISIPYDVERGIHLMGGTAFVHGYSHGESAIRDHVEMYSRPIIMAHIHRAEIARGRSIGSPQGISVGTLANIGAMGYARTRRATLRWGHGFAYGEYCADACQAWLATPIKGEWRFPL